MGCASKYGLITTNVFVVCIGLGLIGISATVIEELETPVNNIIVLMDASYAVPLTTLLIGIFLMLLGLLGCIAAIKENYCMLTTYAVVVGLILLATLISGITLLVFTSTALMILKKSMTDVFKEYGKDGKEEVTHLLDVLQHKGQCCGLGDYQDWAHFPYNNGTSVPDGCCKKWTEGCGVDMLNNPYVMELVWRDGCFGYLHFAFTVIWVALAILAVILIFFQTLSVTWACCLARDSLRRLHYVPI